MTHLTPEQYYLLALYSTASEPTPLGWMVVAVAPAPESSWRRPWRHWRTMTAWVDCCETVVIETQALAAAGLLRRTKRNRWSDMKGLYEITGLGRDVAARNAEVLMAGQVEETA